MSYFGAWINLELEDAGWSSSRFSRAIDVSERVVRTWVLEERLPSTRYLPRIAEFFHAPLQVITRIVAAEDDLSALDDESITFLARRGISPLEKPADEAAHRRAWEQALEAEEAAGQTSFAAPPSTPRARQDARASRAPRTTDAAS
jgi:hypothetical protein